MCLFLCTYDCHFFSSSQFKRWSIKFRDLKSFYCLGFTINSFEELDQFMRRDNQEYHCVICFQFKHKSTTMMRNHLESKHFPNLFTHECSNCKAILRQGVLLWVTRTRKDALQQLSTNRCCVNQNMILNIWMYVQMCCVVWLACEAVKSFWSECPMFWCSISGSSFSPVSTCVGVRCGASAWDRTRCHDTIFRAGQWRAGAGHRQLAAVWAESEALAAPVTVPTVPSSSDCHQQPHSNSQSTVAFWPSRG